MKGLSHTDGFVLHGWMVTQLHLSGGELVTFALVHQFSQSDAGRFTGGPGYVAAWLGCTTRSAIKYLHRLADMHLIVMEDVTVNGVFFRNYRVNWGMLQHFNLPGKNFSTPEKISPTPLKNFQVEDNIENKDINTTLPPTPTKFDFRKALLDAGVEEEVADAWLLVRKTKRATNTKLALDAVLKEIAAAGMTPNAGIRLAAENSWQGFRAAWVKEETPTPGLRRAPSPRRSRTDEIYAHLFQTGRELGIIKDTPEDYDEQ